MRILGLALGIMLLALPSMARSASPHVVAKSESAIAIGKDICGLNHEFQNWDAASIGDHWEVKGTNPLRFVAMAECHVAVPKNGSAPFDKFYLTAPNVPACATDAKVCF